jgi:hypothetical protein
MRITAKSQHSVNARAAANDVPLQLLIHCFMLYSIAYASAPCNHFIYLGSSEPSAGSTC